LGFAGFFFPLLKPMFRMDSDPAIRQQAFTRLSLGFSKKLENLEAACAMFLAYYNFVWRTRKEEGKCRLPAAMAAGVVDTLMSFEDLFDAVMGEGYAVAA
jgi:hypothetical protein